MKKHHLLFLTLPFLLMGCGTKGLSYPPAYIAVGLPTYEHAWVTNNGNEDATPEDGFSIKLRSEKSVQEVRGYYENALFASGWISEAEPPEGWGSFYVRVFEKDDNQIQLLIEDQGPDGRSISIIYNKTAIE